MTTTPAGDDKPVVPPQHDGDGIPDEDLYPLDEADVDETYTADDAQPYPEPDEGAGGGTQDPEAK